MYINKKYNFLNKCTLIFLYLITLLSGGYMSGGICPGGICPAGICPGGICPGGICPAGICPDTNYHIYVYTYLKSAMFTNLAR